MNKALQRLQDRAREHAAAIAQCRAAEMPQLLQDVHLHDYQLEGMRWLLSKDAQDVNPILGDEMGLGKTLQVIAFLAALIEQQSAAPDEDDASPALHFLVVAPLSVVPNWAEQFASFAPAIEVRMCTGLKDERKLAQAEIKALASQVLVVVTSYEMLLSDTEFFNSIAWRVLVLDEGHRLKNSDGKLYGVLKTTFVVKHKVLLTGTPIQNELRELFALLSLLNPTIFDDEDAFEAAFAKTFSATAQNLLTSAGRRTAAASKNSAERLMSEILDPVLLLRSIHDVNAALTLPPISEIVVRTPMSAMQREYYRLIVARNSDAINATTSSRVSLTNVLPHLRKACNHPYLFPGAEPEPFCEGKHLFENSGKLYVLHQLLPRLRERGHCILLFSQSTTFLDIIQDYLTLEGFSYERIDGSVRGKERWQAIDRFRSNPDTFVFLITTRAGGVGLNLQRADTVIFMDSDYNPQIDLQAVARAYRLGQTKPIHVIKFVTAHTVEEIIFRRAQRKMRMADRIRNCARHSKEEEENEEDNDKQSLIELIQFGLHKLLKDSEDANALVKPLEEEYIERILARSELQIPDEDQTLGANATADQDNMYFFEGEDYSTPEARAKDQECLKTICQDGITWRKRGAATRQRCYRYDSEESESSESELDAETIAQNEAEKQRKREERRAKMEAKKLALWQQHNYESAVLPDADAADLDDPTVNFDPSQRVRYVAGDASHPPHSVRERGPIYIVHCVDTSGVWCARGFFRSLSALSPRIQQQYEAAGRLNDLKLGQVHLIPIAAADAATRQAQEIAVCLLVVQGFVQSKKRPRTATGNAGVRVRDGKSTTFRLHALDRSLRALSMQARATGASVHMPRIGYGTPQFQWYAVERVIKRQLAEKGVPTSIYYFAPNRSAPGGS